MDNKGECLCLLTNERLLMLLFRPRTDFLSGCSLVKTATTHTVSGGATERCPTLTAAVPARPGQAQCSQRGQGSRCSSHPQKDRVWNTGGNAGQGKLASRGVAMASEWGVDCQEAGAGAGDCCGLKQTGAEESSGENLGGKPGAEGGEQ